MESAEKSIKDLNRVYQEAVYGQTAGQELAKREKDDDAAGAPNKDKRHVVTYADKRGNTPAYQKYKAGDKNYKAADHLKDEYEPLATSLEESGKFTVEEIQAILEKDSYKTVAAVIDYDRSKKGSKDATYDSDHGEKKKAKQERDYAAWERSKMKKDDPNWKNKKYHTGMHGEEVEGLGKSELEEEDKDLKKRAQFHTARKEFKAYQQKKELKYWKTKKKNPVKAPNQQLKGFSNYVEGVEQVDELYKGKHGQSEKEYQAGRSDAGKRISGDEKHGPASYSRRGVKQQEPTKPGEKPKHTPKLGSAEKSELAYLKSRRAQKEEVQSEERKEVKAPIQEPKEKLKKPSRSDRVAYNPPGRDSYRRGYKLEQVESEVVDEAKVDTGKSADEKATARNQRNNPQKGDKGFGKFATSVFITRKLGEPLATGKDSAASRKRREAHAAKRGVKEEVIDELHKKTLGSYVKKASQDLSDRRFDQGDSEKRKYDPDERDDKEENKLVQREKGIKRAADKLTKEGYQRNPEKGEAEERKAEKRRKESGRMPPRGDTRRADFEKWYAANVK